MIKGYLMAVSAVISVCFIYGLLVEAAHEKRESVSR